MDYYDGVRSLPATNNVLTNELVANDVWTAEFFVLLILRFNFIFFYNFFIEKNPKTYGKVMVGLANVIQLFYAIFSLVQYL